MMTRPNIVSLVKNNLTLIIIFTFRMTIGASTTLYDVFDAQDWKLTETDLAAMTTLDPATDDTRVVTTIGLTGQDIT